MFVGFSLLGLITAIYSIWIIRKSCGQLKGNVMAGISIVLNTFLILPLVLLPVAHFVHDRNSDRRWAGLNQIEELGRAMSEYEKTHGGYFPDANRWCDELLEECKWLSKDYFVHPLRKSDICSFVFNRAISGLPANKIDQNIVLLFESVGPWNLNGGSELLKKRNNFDSYVLLISGKAYRYSFKDMGIEWYDPVSGHFYIEPVIWEPKTVPKMPKINECE